MRQVEKIEMTRKLERVLPTRNVQIFFPVLHGSHPDQCASSHTVSTILFVFLLCPPRISPQYGILTVNCLFLVSNCIEPGVPAPAVIVYFLSILFLDTWV